MHWSTTVNRKVSDVSIKSLFFGECQMSTNRDACVAITWITWTRHISHQVRKAQQRLYFLGPQQWDLQRVVRATEHVAGQTVTHRFFGTKLAFLDLICSFPRI